MWDLPDFVDEGDVVVLNETKVLPARLRGRKAGGGAVEVLLLEEIQLEAIQLEEIQPAGATPARPQHSARRSSEQQWIALVRPSARVPPGTALTVEAPAAVGTAAGVVAGVDAGLEVEVGEHLDAGLRRIRLAAPGGDVAEMLWRFGRVPLPPYIREELDDPDRYQTVYAAMPGSVAAPTAGLHLTTEVLDRCRAKGARVVALDLAVGLGTFRPVTVERLDDHEMHEERYAVPSETMEACRTAERVLAIGTTTARALESAAATGQLSGRTKLLIAGDHHWRVVDRLMTNFHQPRSTLLAMIESFVGPRWRELYGLALAEGYRFLSFGDAMLLDRRDHRSSHP